MILNEIDKALVRKGLSAAAASKLAAEHYALIKNMKAAQADGKRYSVDSLEKLATVLDLELYFGPPRETTPAPVAVLEDEPFDMVARYDAQSAAGNGTVNFEGPPIDHLAFSKKWLGQQNIPLNSQLFLTGYSQGGYVTMAMHKALETLNDIDTQEDWESYLTTH